MATRGGTFGGSRGSVGRGGRGGGATSRPRIVKTHVLSFTDHAGNPVRTVFQGDKNCTLPPLFSFAIYFTHAEAEPDAVDAAGLLATLKDGSPLGHVRLDLYFAPGKKEDDCVAHYQEEKAARGTYEVQIEAFSRGGDPSSGVALWRAPGLVPSYLDNEGIDRYHGLLYVCDKQNWADGKQLLRRVMFDPISQEEYEAMRDGSDPAVLPPTFLAWDAVRDDSPGRGESSGVVGMRMFQTSHSKTENETTAPWQEAVQAGWMSW